MSSARVEASPKPDPPPLVPGTIHGLRMWRVIKEGGSDRVWLSAVSHDVLWPQERPLVAECHRSHSDHEPPAGDCTCGIYALHPTVEALEDHWHVGESERGAIIGLVECWGRIEVHAEGFRAEHARVHSIIAPSADGDPTYEALAAGAAASYGADLLRAPDADALFEHCRANQLGFDAGTVVDLIARDSEVVIRPHACGFINHGGLAVGGTGYRLRDQEERFTLYGPECEAGLPAVRLLRVAGVGFHWEALQSEACEPGRPLTLDREPENRHDPNAVAILDEQRASRLGYVPRHAAAEVSGWIESGRLARALSVWQWRDLRTGERIGLHVLVSVSERIHVDSGEQELEDEDLIEF